MNTEQAQRQESARQARGWGRTLVLVSVLSPAAILGLDLSLCFVSSRLSFFVGACLALVYAGLTWVVVQRIAATWPESGGRVLLLPVKTLAFLGFAWLVGTDPRMDPWAFGMGVGTYPLSVVVASLLRAGFYR